MTILRLVAHLVARPESLGPIVVVDNGIVGLGRYKYHFVRGDDLEAAVTREAAKRDEVHFRGGRVTEIRQAGQSVEAIVDGEILRADRVFDSVLRHGPVRIDGWLIFRGWYVRTAEPAFDSAVPTFFDFRTSQSRAASFVGCRPQAWLDSHHRDQNLLDAVAGDPALLEQVFPTCSTEQVLHFLDEENSLPQEGKLFARLPPSLYSAMRRRHR
ncbi:lycopene cyclase family protein [Amycolatopsis alba]|uniref:Uncharacterized protein n=1 Tax=Amycolatopsis alba DSM 44262 TaxID=1125972 RepID=A0A229RVM5_AMYAL|nr:lycopene cyclase family protein [Amycolatopsis alba]OXM50404.1 hypothetical protein CFP75_16025 [Amycolatopsis alba DSM 44262]